MKSFLSIPLKLLLVTLATLSQFFFTNSTSVQGRGLGYIENISEKKEDVERELQKQETTLKKLELAEKSARKLFLSYGGYSKIPNNKSFDYVGNCAPTNDKGKYGSVTCKERLLRKMCETELKLETFNYVLTFCQKYFDLATSNQSLYSEETQVKSSRQMCRVLPFRVERYQHLDNNSLEKVLLACQQALLKVNHQFSYSYGGNVLLLRNLKEIYLVLEDSSRAKDFFTNIINIAKKKDKQNNRQSLEKQVTPTTINTIYPALNFLGDIYFATEEWDKAMNLYLEADSIYTKYINYQDSNYPRFLIDTSATAGYLSPRSITRGYSFFGSRSRLALILAMKGKTNDGKKLFDETILYLDDVSRWLTDREDAIALREIATPLYTAQQFLLINDKKYEKALEYAERSRSASYVSRNPPDVLSFEEMQAVAKDQKATLVLYSIPDLPIYDYDKFQAREDKVLIWVIQPNGKLDFREVDVSSVLNQSNSKSEFNNINSTRFVYGAVNSTFIYGGIVLVVIIGAFAILSPNNRRMGVATLIGISAGLVVANLVLTNTSSNSSSKHQLREKEITEQNQETTQQNGVLSTLIKDTLSAIKKPDIDETSLLKKLHQVLIEPIQDTLPTNPDEHIVLIPYRGLHRVPFASLISSDNKYLIDLHTIRIAPSIQALKFIAERAASLERVGNDYLIVGNPEMSEVSVGSFGVTEELAQLTSAEVEAREIAKLYGTTPLIGEDASIEKVRSKLFNSRILHFATHGLLNISNSGAGLVFASQSQEDNSGVLTTREFYQNRFLAEMVVLSACNTGLGTETVEGNLGLTRPFLITGVPTVVSSLWSIPDIPTAELMINFYQNLKDTSDKAKALRQAMLNTKTKYPNPVNWAGFILTGLAESPKTSTSTSVKQVIGYQSCSRTDGRGYAGNRSSDLVSANLKSVANGFSLTFTYTNGSKYKLHLDQNLALVGRSSYHKKTQWSRLFVTNYEKTTATIKIEPDGSFDASMLITLRHYCVMKGKLEFIGDAADKLPKN